LKISDLIAHLEIMKEDHGDLDCAVYADSGVQPVGRPKIYALQDFDFGKIDGRRTGERLAMLWVRQGFL
jgi:hypothetical protein